MWVVVSEHQSRNVRNAAVRIFPTLFFALVLFSSILTAQPRVEEERPLARAVREAHMLADRQQYVLAIEHVQRALDTAATGEYRADAYYLLAQANINTQQYYACLASCRAFLGRYGNDNRAADVQYMQGVSAYQEGLVGEAGAAFYTVAGANSVRMYEAHYWVARMYADSNRLDSAETYAEKSIAGPAHEFTDDALFLSAWIKEGHGEIEPAAVLYRQITTDYPERDIVVDAQLRLGVIEARQGYYESALTLLNSLTLSTDRQREEQLFYQGEINGALGRYPEAIRAYTEFLREFPQSRHVRPVRYGMGWAQQQSGKWDEAINTFRQLTGGVDSLAAASLYQIGAIQTLRGDTAGSLRTFHDLVYRLPYESFSDNAYFQLGKVHYRRGNYDSAAYYFTVVARQFPESDVRVDAYYLQGEAYAALGRYSSAAYAFGRTQKIGATGTLYSRALYREGVMLYDVGRFRSATDRLRKYVSEHGDGAQIDEATFWLGEALYQDGAYSEAEQYYKSVIDHSPKSKWREAAAYGFAWAQFQQKDFDGAVTAFNDFRKAYPNSENAVEATIRLADAYRLQGRYDDAVKTYESVDKQAGIGVRAEEARFRLAEVFLELKDTSRAIQTLRNLVRDYPESPRVDAYAFNIATIYYDQSEDSLTINELNRFLKTYPASELAPQAYYTIGDAWYNLEMYDSAFASYKSVLDKYPNSLIIPDALDAVRFSLDALGRGRDAVYIIDDFMRRNPDRIPADSLTYKKATILFENGDFTEATEVYRKMLEVFEESLLLPDALHQIGRCYEYSGDTDSALLVYRQVVDTYPQSDASQNALIDMGELHLRREEWSSAASDFQLLTLRFPESTRLNQARYGRGQALLATSDTVGALAQYRAVVDSVREEDAGDSYIDLGRIAWAKIVAAQGDIDQALDLLAPVVARRMDYAAADALLLRGKLLLQVNDLSGALAELRRLTIDFAEFYEYSEPGMLVLGELYEELTNYAAARETYEALIDQTEDEGLITEAKARLKRLKK